MSSDNTFIDPELVQDFVQVDDVKPVPKPKPEPKRAGKPSSDPYTPFSW